MGLSVNVLAFSGEQGVNIQSTIGDGALDFSAFKTSLSSWDGQIASLGDIFALSPVNMFTCTERTIFKSSVYSNYVSEAVEGDSGFYFCNFCPTSHQLCAFLQVVLFFSS